MLHRLLPVFVILLTSCGSATNRLSTSQGYSESATAELSSDQPVQGRPLVIKPGSTLIKWYESLAKIDYVAAIPASADIKVGDMFLEAKPIQGSTAEERLLNFMHGRPWSTVDFSEALGKRYEIGQAGIRSPAVGMSFLATTSSSDDSINELLPSTEIGPLLKGGEVKSVVLRPVELKSHMVPKREVLERLTIEENGKIVLQRDHAKFLKLTGSGDNSYRVWIHVITGSLRMVSYETAVSGRIPMREDHSSPVAETNPTIDLAGSNYQGNESSNDPFSGTRLRAFSNAIEINDFMEKEVNLQDNNRMISFVHVTDDSMLFRTHLKEPLVIGVRGVTLEVDSKTAEVISLEDFNP